MAKTITDSEKLHYMRILEQHDGNITHASKAVGVSRTSMIKYKKLYFDDYLKKKEEIIGNQIINKSAAIQASSELDRKLSQLTLVIDLAIDKAYSMLNNFDTYYEDNRGVRHYRVSMAEVNQFLNVTLPYVAEKRGVINPEVGKGASITQNNYTSYVQNIVNKMEEKQKTKIIKSE